MRRRTRTVRMMKVWGAVWLTAILLVSGVSMYKVLFLDAGTWGFGVNCAGIDVAWGDDVSPFRNPGGWSISKHSWKALPTKRWIGWPDGPSLTWLRFPLWILIVPLAGLTALSWYLDRPFPAGCCQNCGYDLTGNESGRCPECGAEARRGDTAR